MSAMTVFYMRTKIALAPDMEKWWTAGRIDDDKGDYCYFPELYFAPNANMQE